MTEKEITQELKKITGEENVLFYKSDEINEWVCIYKWYDTINFKKEPKGGFTAKYILEKAAKKEATSQELKKKRSEAVQNLSDYIKVQTGESDLRQAAAYPTSFGFSVCNLFQDGIKKAEELCKKAQIKYKRMEYSQAHWVVRVFL